MKHILFFVVLLFVVSAATGQTATSVQKATSFAGKPLYLKVPDAKVLAKSDSVIASIKSKGKLKEDDYVEIGKQYVATTRYQEAIDLYTKGLAKFPQSYKILRNRGHRYLTLRQVDKALADLTKAEKLVRTQPDVMEFGLDGKPTATVRHQIWYHIGVSNYLMGNYAKAVAAFEQAVATGGDLKNVVGASDWLYNSSQRAGDKDKAAKTIASITPDLDTDRDNVYFRRIMLYKGVIKPEELVDVTIAPEKMTIQDVTKMYGLANWYSYNGDKQKANSLYKIIISSPDAWPGWAYAGAEKDVVN
ncbi:hypothetical protein BH10BAC4_BH10BAC4_24550 [soil metagenome]